MMLEKKLTRINLFVASIFLLSLFKQDRAEAVDIYNNFGVGLGVPYGILGVSYELEINILDYIAIGPTVAVGSTVLGGSATELGLQLHFGDKEGLIRYGISFWSGTNTIIETSPDEYVTEDGETAGINLRFQFGNSRSHSLDIHVLKILDPKEEEVLMRYGGGEYQGGDVKLGIGYIYSF